MNKISIVPLKVSLLLVLFSFLLSFIFTNSALAESCTDTNQFYRDLKEGSKGNDVTALQKALISSGYLKMPSGAAYGYFGSLTKTALINYQRNKGLRAEGYFGPLTRKAIATCSTPQNYQSQSGSNTSNYSYNNVYTGIVWPTAQEVANMPVYKADVKPKSDLHASITNSDYLVFPINSSNYSGQQTANANFSLVIKGGSGSYKANWIFDDLKTTTVSDSTFSEQYFSSDKTRSIAKPLSGPGFWIVNAYVVDSQNNKSSTSTVFAYVGKQSLIDKLNKLDSNTLTSEERKALNTDLEVREYIGQAFTNYMLLENSYYDSTSAKEKGESASAKSNLSSVRAQAELYYSNNLNTYSGACKDKMIKSMFKSAEVGLTGPVNCVDSKEYWRAFGTLKETGEFWCVDSSGMSEARSIISGYTCDPEMSKSR